MNIDQHAVARFAESLKSKGKLPATIESYSRDARRFIEYLQAHNLATTDLEPQILFNYQNYLIEHCSGRENSVRRSIIGIRQFFRHLTEERTIRFTPFDDVPIPERFEVLPKCLGQHDVDLILKTAKGDKATIKTTRDCAIICLIAYEGLKANELINLQWGDLLGDHQQATLHVRGLRSRAIALNQLTNQFLWQYRQHYAELSKQYPFLQKDERLLISFKGQNASKPIPVMTRHGLKFILYELGEKTNLKHLNTELLRHYAVTYLLNLGRSPEDIMKHLGLRRLGNIAKHVAVQPRKINTSLNY